MTVGTVRPFTITMPTATTLTSAIDVGGAYSKMMLGIPTMTSGTNIFVHASDASDGVFRKVFYPGYVDTTTQAVVEINSSVTNCFVPVDIHARYLKLEFTTAAANNGHTFKLICSAD